MELRTLGRSRGTWMPFLVIALTLLLAFGMASLVQGRAHADEVVHGRLVPEIPRRDTPIITDGAGLAVTVVGNKVVVGGSFTTVQTVRNGPTVTRPYLMAYDINTGAYDAGFAPILDGQVTSLAADPDGRHVYVGGAFNNVNGELRRKIARVDVTTGELDTNFRSNADAEVKALALSGNRLFVGGSFALINGVSRMRLAEVDATTGAVATGFNLPVTEGIGADHSLSVRALDISPDDSRLVVGHSGRLVAGVEHRGVAIVNIAGGASTLTGWNTDVYKTNCRDGYEVSVRDLDIAPSGAYFVVTTKGDDHPPCGDTAVAFPLAGDGAVEPLWVARMFDSVYSVAISDVAVYIGGHFRYAEAPGSLEPWPGESNIIYRDPSLLGDQVVRVHQLAALDPQTGKALPWDPGTDAFEATFDLDLIDRGLLLAMDGSRVNQVLTGRSAFLDFGGFTPGPEPIPQPTTTTQPPATTTTQPPATTTTQPGVTTTQPAVTTTQPGVTTTQPPVTTTQPPVTTTQPGVTTTQPGVTTTQPAVTTTQPGASTTQPPVSTTSSPATTIPPVTTTTPSGLVVPSVGGGRTLVLIVNSTGALRPSDRALIQKFTQAGFRVVTISETTPGRIWSKASIIVVAPSVSGAAMQDRFDNETRPVVALRARSADAIGLSNPSGPSGDLSTSTATIDLGGGAHPISQAAGLEGQVPLLSRPAWISYGVPGVGATTVGQLNANPSLFTYERGDRLADGGKSKGCRAAFPGDDVTAITDQGWTLMIRTLEWAAGSCRNDS